MRADPNMPVVFTRDDALAAGMSRHQIAHRVRTLGWRALRRGVYIQARRYSALSVREQHTAAVVATLISRPEDVVASHLSAAVAYGWVLPLAGAGPVTITQGDLDAPTRHGPNLTLQVASLPASDVRTISVCVAGTRWQLPTTSQARTVADTLRHLSNPDGVALADSALRGGKVFYDEVAAVLRRQSSWPYAENARRALPLVDPRRESWLESYSFVTLHRMGLPMPEPQVSLFDTRGHFVARVDGWLESEAVALESDGKGKYFLDEPRLSVDVDSAAEELLDRAKRRIMQEKERRDRIADLGAELARWGTREIVRSPREVLARIAGARQRGDGERFRGRTAYLPAPGWLLPARTRAG
ncbi:MAG: hypothetical protein ABI662_11460 [Dermatophilaceae bacterium]